MIDITDYGAVADDGSNDTQAFRDAIDAASNGDTIYVPSGTYHVKADDPTVSGTQAINIDADTDPNDLTIEGDGESSEIVLMGDHTGNHSIIDHQVRDGLTITYRDLKFNGNKSAQSASDGGNCLEFGTSNDGHRNDILVKNCWIVDGNQSNILVYYANNVAVEDCTITGAGSDHGIAYKGTEDGGSDRGVFRNCHVSGSNIYAIDISNGSALVEDCVLESNGWGSKSTVYTNAVTFRRVRFKDNDHHGYQRTPSDGSRTTDVTFEDCIAEGNGWAGFRLGQDTEYTLQGQGIEAIGNNTTDRSNGNIYITNNATVDGGDVYSCNAANGYGLMSTTSGSANIDRYQHRKNPSGGLGKSENLTISTKKSGACGRISGVPTTSDVGAGRSLPENTATLRTSKGTLLFTGSAVKTN